MTYNELASKLLNTSLTEADVVNFMDKLHQMGPKGQSKARQIQNTVTQNNGVHPGAEEYHIDFEQAYPKIEYHPWVEWMAQYILDTQVRPFYGSDPNDLPQEAPGLPRTFVTAARDVRLVQLWFEICCRRVMTAWMKAPDDPRMFEYVESEVDLPKVEVDRIKTLARNLIRSKNNPAFETLMKAHPQFLYDAMSMGRGGAKFWENARKLSRYVAAGFIWMEVASSAERDAMLATAKS